MSDLNLRINGIEIPTPASVALTQNYEDVSASYPYRMRDGSLKKRTAWSGKLKTTIAGRGTVPAGLSAFDYTQPLVLSCVEPRSIISASRVIDLPTSRRTDATALPYGLAFVGSGWVETGLEIVGNTATLVEVASASAYLAGWFPELSVFADPPREGIEAGSASYGWSLEAAER